MKENNFYYIEDDINTIECTLTIADVVIEEAQDGKLTVTYPDAANIRVGNNKDELVLFQDKRTIFTRAPQKFKISVPTHTVPAIRINGKHVTLRVVNGIYGDLYFGAEDGAISLSDSVFGDVEISGGDVQSSIAGATVKGNLSVNIDRGNAAVESSFAKRAEFRIKRGNIGMFNVSCRDCAFDVRKGNITASLAGKEETFNTTLLAQDGIVNRESAKHDGASGNLSACAGRGNITLDFVEGKENV